MLEIIELNLDAGFIKVMDFPCAKDKQSILNISISYQQQTLQKCLVCTQMLTLREFLFALHAASVFGGVISNRGLIFYLFLWSDMKIIISSN